MQHISYMFVSKNSLVSCARVRACGVRECRLDDCHRLAHTRNTSACACMYEISAIYFKCHTSIRSFYCAAPASTTTYTHSHSQIHKETHISHTRHFLINARVRNAHEPHLECTRALRYAVMLWCFLHINTCYIICTHDMHQYACIIVI